MPTLYDTDTDREYFRIGPWIETGWSGWCSAEACDDEVQPSQEIIPTETGPQHVDCVIAEMLDGGDE